MRIALLEKRGLVERHAHERDRRLKAVALSNEGEATRLPDSS
jgi:DNA-binding MarR family transcriptional regulator